MKHFKLSRVSYLHIMVHTSRRYCDGDKYFTIRTLCHNPNAFDQKPGKGTDRQADRPSSEGQFNNFVAAPHGPLPTLLKKNNGRWLFIWSSAVWPCLYSAATQCSDFSALPRIPRSRSRVWEFNAESHSERIREGTYSTGQDLFTLPELHPAPDANQRQRPRLRQ